MFVKFYLVNSRNKSLVYEIITMSCVSNFKKKLNDLLKLKVKKKFPQGVHCPKVDQSSSLILSSILCKTDAIDNTI